MACLGVNKSHASKILARLASTGHVVRIKRGVWVFSRELDPLSLPEYLTAPFPCYVSLQTALYYHGMISQIPEVIYVVSLARTRVFKTAMGTFSIHHVTPSFLFGYDRVGKYQINIAIPEKALIDFLYFSPTRSKLFHSLPELELGKEFSKKKARQIISRIETDRQKTYVQKKFKMLIEALKLS
jgi:predicted transcriptional regulator of viral defense system